MTKFNTIMVTSGYGGNSRQPFVEIKTDKLKAPLQLSPEEARDLALNLLSAAEASEQDAFIVEFHSAFIEGSEVEKRNVGASMLIEFRKWRDEHGQNR
jgi:hypothetical protein